MEVTGHLREPLLDPCPGGNDLAQLRDDRCQPVKCSRQPDWTGRDCCQFWKSSPNVWGSDIVRVDQLNPEKFKYDQYRYQVFAKPNNINEGSYGTVHSAPDKQYVAPTTDIRALRQTTYIPMVPHNPGGVTDFTFPMTPQTMGEPDVTSACCVPVIPCNPGFQNLTPSVRSDPNYMCQTYNRCKQPMQIGPRRVNINSEMLRTEMPPEYDQNMSQMAGSGPQFFSTPSNQLGGAGQGVPQMFSEPQRPYAVPYPPQLHAPHHNHQGHGDQNGCMSHDSYSLGLDHLEDGVNPRPGQGAAFTNVKSVRYQDRVNRLLASKAETSEDRIRRLKSMYGAFGSYLSSTPYTRRYLEGVRDTIIHQGNGFAWNYPKHANRLCYVVERNTRC